MPEAFYIDTMDLVWLLVGALVGVKAGMWLKS